MFVFFIKLAVGQPAFQVWTHHVQDESILQLSRPSTSPHMERMGGDRDKKFFSFFAS
jgi:hypothetical protein